MTMKIGKIASFIKIDDSLFNFECEIKINKRYQFYLPNPVDRIRNTLKFDIMMQIKTNIYDSIYNDFVYPI